MGMAMLGSPEEDGEVEAHLLEPREGISDSSPVHPSMEEPFMGCVGCGPGYEVCGEGGQVDPCAGERACKRAPPAATEQSRAAALQLRARPSDTGRSLCATGPFASTAGEV